ncbi:hypothetical protein DIPPA_27173 [Diplonema papillatum]|nr:hypothetical protein DIPPA_27173 [Diplonema papillatum]
MTWGEEDGRPGGGEAALGVGFAGEGRRAGASTDVDGTRQPQGPQKKQPQTSPEGGPLMEEDKHLASSSVARSATPDANPPSPAAHRSTAGGVKETFGLDRTARSAPNLENNTFLRSLLQRKAQGGAAGGNSPSAAVAAAGPAVCRGDPEPSALSFTRPAAQQQQQRAAAEGACDQPQQQQQQQQLAASAREKPQLGGGGGGINGQQQQQQQQSARGGGGGGINGQQQAASTRGKPQPFGGGEQAAAAAAAVRSRSASQTAFARSPADPPALPGGFAGGRPASGQSNAFLRDPPILPGPAGSAAGGMIRLGSGQTTTFPRDVASGRSASSQNVFARDPPPTSGTGGARLGGGLNSFTRDTREGEPTGGGRLRVSNEHRGGQSFLARTGGPESFAREVCLADGGDCVITTPAASYQPRLVQLNRPAAAGGNPQGASSRSKSHENPRAGSPPSASPPPPPRTDPESAPPAASPSKPLGSIPWNAGAGHKSRQCMSLMQGTQCPEPAPQPSTTAAVQQPVPPAQGAPHPNPGGAAKKQQGPGLGGSRAGRKVSARQQNNLGNGLVFESFEPIVGWAVDRPGKETEAVDELEKCIVCPCEPEDLVNNPVVIDTEDKPYIAPPPREKRKGKRKQYALEKAGERTPTPEPAAARDRGRKVRSASSDHTRTKSADPSNPQSSNDDSDGPYNQSTTSLSSSRKASEKDQKQPPQQQARAADAKRSVRHRSPRPRALRDVGNAGGRPALAYKRPAGPRPLPPDDDQELVLSIVDTVNDLLRAPFAARRVYVDENIELTESGSALTERELWERERMRDLHGQDQALPSWVSRTPSETSFDKLEEEERLRRDEEAAYYAREEKEREQKRRLQDEIQRLKDEQLRMRLAEKKPEVEMPGPLPMDDGFLYTIPDNDKMIVPTKLTDEPPPVVIRWAKKR